MLYCRWCTIAVLLFIFNLWNPNTLKAQLNADFTANSTEGCAPLVVQFLNQSTGNISSYSWSLGDPDGSCNSGPTSDLANPGRIFTDPGIYCICLTVEDGNGSSDTECKTQYIEVYQPPQSDFEGTNLVGCAPLTVNLSDLSTPGTGTIVAWQWDLNNTSCIGLSGPSVSCTYDTPGSYDITLITTDIYGCTHFITKEDFVLVSDQPMASFSADVTGTCAAPLTVNFSNNIPNTANVDFEWWFGDGSTSNDPNPTYTYNNSGDYDVGLVATNTITGCSDTLVVNDYIAIGNAVNFTFTPESGCEDLTVDFTDLTPSSANWQWDFGDGMGTSMAQNPSYTYTDPGCFFVTLTASTLGCSGSRTAEVCIEVFPEPAPSYSASGNYSCEVPYTVNFTASATSANQFIWDFGDGTIISDGSSISHVYNEHGSYPVSLTVITADGCSSTVTTETILIEPLDVTIIPSQQDGCAPLSIDFSESNNIPNSANVDFE